MNFSPHHRFLGCDRLEQTLDRIRVAGNLPNAVQADHQKYHFSLLHKLQSARYHVETLRGYLSSQNAQQINPHLLVYRVNFHFDGFLHVLGSTLDILAREVLGYFPVVVPAKVYYQTARAAIAGVAPADPILPLLADPTWRAEFSTYRNTATHESIVGTGYQIDIVVAGNQSHTKVVFPIPDDPRVPNSPTRHNPDIVVYCERTFVRVLTHTNRIYEHIQARAAVKGSLPL